MTSPLLLATQDSYPDPQSALIASWALRIAVVADIAIPEAQQLLCIVITSQGLEWAKRYVEQVEECATSSLAASTARLTAAYCAAYRPLPDDDVA